jgi:hypothetical protein
MYILVASVHHTGTKTIFNDLLSDWTTIINQQDPDPPKSGKLRIHIEESFIDDLEVWLKKSKTIVPIRHPRTVAVGWKSRFKTFDRLEIQWNLLKERIDPYVPYYIPIDRIDRNKWLRKFNSDTGLEFTTDWPVIGKHTAEEQELDENEERLVASWMEDGFFDRFGYF